MTRLLSLVGLMRVSEHEAKAREAFKAGWRTNAVGEETHPASYLDGCEQVDFEEYQRLGVSPYIGSLASDDDDILPSWKDFYKQAVADLEKQAGEIALLKSDVSELQGHLFDARHDLDASRHQVAALLPDALAMRRKRQRDRDRRKGNG